MTNAERIQINNAELREAIKMVKSLGTSIPTQEKAVDIMENGTHSITPDEGYVLSKVTVNTDVPNDRSIENSIVTRSITTYTNEKISTVGGQAFYGCSKLTTVHLPNVEAIGSNGFRNCSALVRVDLGVEARAINANTFNGCSKLVELIIRYNNVCTLGASTSLASTAIANGTGYVYVPSAMVDRYKSATNWSAHASQIRAIEDYPEVCG